MRMVDLYIQVFIHSFHLRKRLYVPNSIFQIKTVYVQIVIFFVDIIIQGRNKYLHQHQKWAFFVCWQSPISGL